MQIYQDYCVFRSSYNRAWAINAEMDGVDRAGRQCSGTGSAAMACCAQITSERAPFRGSCVPCQSAILPRGFSIFHVWWLLGSTYLDEDLIGRCKKIIVHTHPGTFSVRALQHYCVMVCLRWIGPKALEA